LKQTCVAKHGSLAFLPTDWATAFDGISPDSLIVALWRVSVQNNSCPIMDEYILVAGMRRNQARKFRTSQKSPFPPFLLSLVTTVLFFDASATPPVEAETRRPGAPPITELVFADDRLVCRAETNMRRIETMQVKHGPRVNGTNPTFCQSGASIL